MPWTVIVTVSASQITAQGASAVMKSSGEIMDIIAAYREVGTYRGAAVMCGTTHKTVKRIIERAEAGGRHPAANSGDTTTTRSPSWSPRR
jgi:hypothetical protein